LTTKNNIILFDGICNFCNYWVNFALKNNKKKNLLFSPLQGIFAKNALHKFGLDTTSLTSVIFIKDDKIYTQSSAVFRISKELNWPWKILFAFIIIPKFIRDFIYNIFAKNRYKWYGKKETCRIPTKEERERFLD
jgi:predicted DCC family thiol-disulfide oxidoreductase YuxK